METPLKDPVTLTVPRTVLVDITQLSAGLTDRMHQLLERNTDGQLTSLEKSELETLVHMATFGQMVSAVLQMPDNP